MKGNRTDLILFIDLSFVLLVGLLVLTETAPRSNVVLPGDAEEPSEAVSALAVFNVHFDEEAQHWIVSDMLRFCNVDGQKLLEPCMQQIVQDHASAVFVLVPVGQATVQQLVTLLDLCKFKDWTCTVSN